MAEDRAIAALAAGCKAGADYSAWTVFYAFLQRRYLSPHIGMSADVRVNAACEFVFNAFNKALRPFLAAALAEKLSEALVAILAYHNQLPGDSFSGSMFFRLDDLYRSVLSSPLYFYKDDKVRLGKMEFVDDIDPAVRTGHHLGLWLIAELRFCESILLLNYQSAKAIYIQSGSTLASMASAEAISATREWMNPWISSTFGAAMNVVFCLSQLSQPAPSGGAAVQTEPRGSTPCWTLPKALLRAIKWSIYHKNDAVQREMVTFLWESSWVYMPSFYEKKCTFTLFAYDVLGCSDAYRSLHLPTAYQDDGTGAECKLWKNYPPVSVVEACNAIHFVHEILSAKINDELEANSDNLSRNDKETSISLFNYYNLKIFVHCYLSILDCFIRKRQKMVVMDQPETFSRSELEVYKKLIKQLCNMFSGRLKDLEFLDWEKMARAMADA
ncbi:unnamed protein product [Phytomonas sp. Hart1]|nr:unnamed protein product [Phytomonas sp. Hart1]|eukprot:CCW66940.1 unnamed protein product [Phytomonas sp. isolate Hart1]